MTDFTGTAGDDYLVGTDGDDTFTFSSVSGNDAAAGAAGNDRLVVELAPLPQDPLYVALTAGAGGIWNGYLQGESGFLGFSGMERFALTLSGSDDSVYVTSQAGENGSGLVLDGGAGSNRLMADFIALSDTVLVLAADGAITSSFSSFSRFQAFDVWLGTGNDTVTTGDLNDTVYDSGGTLTLATGGGDDIVTTMGSVGTFDAGDGHDIWSAIHAPEAVGALFVLSANGSSDGGMTVANVEDVRATGGTGDDTYRIDGTLAYALVADAGGTDAMTVDFSGSGGGGGSFFQNIHADGAAGIAANLSGANGSTQFAGMDDVSITFGEGDDYVNVDPFVLASASASPAVLSLDGGLGTNTLNIGFGGMAGVDFILAADSSITASHGTFARFQRFDIRVEAGVRNAVITTGGLADTIASRAEGSVIDAGAGDDTITTTGGPGSVDGGEGTDSWTIDTGARTLGQDHVLSAVGMTVGTATGENIEYVSVTGGTGDDTYFADGSLLYTTIFDTGGVDSLTLDLGARSSPYQVAYVAAETGGSFYGWLYDTSGAVQFNGIEHAAITLGSGADTLYVTARPLIEGATLSLDGGAGDDLLGLDWRDTGGVTFSVATDGTIASSLGAFTGFERFALTLGAGTNTVATGAGGDTFELHEGTHVITAGGGDDRITRYAGSLDFDGGAGYDSAWLDYSGDAVPIALTIDAAVTGTLTRVRGTEDVVALGTAGADSFTVRAGLQVLALDGGGGEDTIAMILPDAAGPGSLFIETWQGAFSGGYATPTGVSLGFSSMEHVTVTLGAQDNASIVIGAEYARFGGTLYVDGGGGEDTITISGFSTGFSITSDGANGYVIDDIDASDGDQGVYTVTAIENLVFWDRTVVLTYEDTGGNTGGIFTGTSGDDTLTGTDFDDTLQGGAGNDILIGGGGTDTALYTEATGGVRVDLAVTGQQNTISAGRDTLTGIENVTGSAHADLLYGNAQANVLDGGAGADLLDGRGGADTMRGGTGNDVYVVDNVGDVVIELAGEGTDTVRTTLSSYTLGDNLEGLSFSGTGPFAGTGICGRLPLARG